MAIHGHHQQHQSTLNAEQQRLLSHRLLLEEQSHLIHLRNEQKAKSRSPVCPNLNIAGHSNCWYCHQNAPSQVVSSTDALLQYLARPVVRPVINQFRSVNYTHPSNHIDATLPQQLALHQPATFSSELPHASAPSSHKVALKFETRASTSTANVKSEQSSAAVTRVKAEALPPKPFTDLPPEDGFVPVRIPETFSRFFQLHEETRKRIYAYLVDNGRHGLLFPKDFRYYHQAAITRTCRSIRKETIDMVYLNNAFLAETRELCKLGQVFAVNIGDEKCKLIRTWKWYTANRTAYIHLDPKATSFHVTYEGHKSDENQAVAHARAVEIHNYLSAREVEGSLGLNVKDIMQVSDIVLRPNTKSKKAKVEAAS